MLHKWHQRWLTVRSITNMPNCYTDLWYRLFILSLPYRLLIVINFQALIEIRFFIWKQKIKSIVRTFNSSLNWSVKFVSVLFKRREYFFVCLFHHWMMETLLFEWREKKPGFKSFNEKRQMCFCGSFSVVVWVTKKRTCIAFTVVLTFRSRPHPALSWVILPGSHYAGVRAARAIIDKL